jgi:ATP-dependent protease Clp ATPase subunit
VVEPKNGPVKQYHRLFEMESIELIFAEETLAAIARKATELKTGALYRESQFTRCDDAPSGRFT